ncbi:TPA: hypothetical protein ACRRGN_000866 [Klebsiella pneumoniae]
MVRMWDDLNDQYAPPEVVRELARMALAAMDSESGCLPLDYLQGHKDGLEWAAQLAEANHPETGDWFYDDPIELAKAIRKGPDMPPVQPVPVVSADLLHTAASAIEDLLEYTDPNTSNYSGVWADVPGKLRATMRQAGNCRENANSSTNNCRETPDTSTNRSHEHFISLCNEFWNWSEMDEVCAEDRGYELRMEWDGKVFKHPVTQALWRMYQAAPQEVK